MRILEVYISLRMFNDIYRKISIFISLLDLDVIIKINGIQTYLLFYTIKYILKHLKAKWAVQWLTAFQFPTLIKCSLQKIVLSIIFYDKNAIFHLILYNAINDPSSSMSGFHFIGCNSCTSFHDPFLVTVLLRDAFDPLLRMYSETI